VVGRASTTSRVAELDILVQVGVSKGEWGETQDDPLGFVSCAIVLQCYCLCCSSSAYLSFVLIQLCNHKKGVVPLVTQTKAILTHMVNCSL